ncbi:HAMP domain-containing protein [Paenibacillus sp. LMG 31460]|uniref:histidine kinase n=1 Tax=Paenibacillus germinis TaxID=2654979 RepID=A0ABX1Z5Y1_9BACL|nr:sensor histidine kinase [Paenibacillus germinis]NOU88687.1 HAMP domain-containing protein [Paenibacillus germinis]
MRASFLSFIQRSFFVKVIFILFLISVVPLLIFAYLTVTLSNQTVMDKVKKLNLQVVNQVMERTDITMLRMQQVSSQYGISPSMINLMDSQKNFYNYVVQNQELQRVLDTAKAVIGDINDIGIYSVESGEVVTSLDPIAPLTESRYTKLIARFEQSNKPFLLVDDRNAEDSFLQNNSFFMRKVPYSNGVGYKGVLMITLPNEALKKAIQNIDLGPEGAVYIVSPDKKVIATTSREDSFELIKHTGQLLDNWQQRERSDQFTLGHSLVSVKQSKYFHGWIVISEIPDSQLSESTHFITKSALVVLFALMMLGLIVSLTVGYSLYRPLQRLKRHMRLIQQGDFTTHFTNYPNNEIGDLGFMLNKMGNRLQSLVEDLQKSEDLKRRNEIRALQSQINPHFMYNTLNTISVFATLRDYKKIKTMMHNLITILRYSMENYEQLVPLSLELNYIADYVNLLQLRYDRPIHLQLEIDESMNDMLIPKLLLQPLIENSLFHGILAKEDDEGLIIVRATRTTEKTVLLQVGDNGKGIDPDRLEALRNDLAHSLPGESIGVKNVWERVRLLYGEQAEFQIECPGDGTVVSIHIPCDRLYDEKEDPSLYDAV